MKITISPIPAVSFYFRCLSFIVKGITSTITIISWFFGSWITSSTPGPLFFSSSPYICIKTFSNNSVSFAPTTSIYINLNKTQKKELISFGIHPPFMRFLLPRKNCVNRTLLWIFSQNHVNRGLLMRKQRNGTKPKYRVNGISHK